MNRGCRIQVIDNEPSFAPTSIARTVRGMHRKWIEKLHEYRSILIHEKPDSGSGTLRTFYVAERSEHWLDAPRKLVSTFSGMESFAKEPRISLAWAAYWLCDCTLRSTKLLIDELRLYMEEYRKYQPSEEVFTMKDEPFPLNIERLPYKDLLPDERDPNW